MYLHLGSDVSLFSDDIVGIFDYRLVDSPSFKEFIDAAEWQNKICILKGQTKSVVIALNRIYFTPVSRVTLARRWKNQKTLYKAWRV